ncbi:hypothetical protein [Sphingomonas sp.]|uniref:O-antigen ligase family protein n=1 Tax=Sphingomonas sp. TaxID=28214 RepID=UPI001B08F1DD|nr:hypothetical protein [Sphingomonas sp.]MBO9711493.1 hypothetical protein [Sphingomonas sp.]
MPPIFYFIPVGIVLATIGARFWRPVVVGVLVWLLFEGAVRKWVLPQFQGPILLLKDGVLLAAYLGYFVSERSLVQPSERLRGFGYLFLVVCVYCGLEVLNPNSPSVALALYGLKNYLLYVPLAFVIPELFRTRQDIHKVILWMTLLAFPICLLALYQFTQPPASWVNLYVSHDAAREEVAAVFGQAGQGEFTVGRARTSSTFSYLSGFTTYLTLMLPFFASMLLHSYGRNRETLMIGAAMVLTVAATLTTGSRSPVITFFAVAPLLVLIAGGKGMLSPTIMLRVVVGTVVVSISALWIAAGAASAFLYRANNADSASDRLVSPITEAIRAYNVTPLFGLGIGSNSNAAVTLAGSDFYWLQGNFFEGEFARVMQDLGFAGFTLVYGLKVYAVVLISRFIMQSRSRLFVALHSAALGFMLPHFLLFTVNNPTGGVMFWSLLGLSVAMNRIERRELAVLHELNLLPDSEPRMAAA